MLVTLRSAPVVMPRATPIPPPDPGPERPLPDPPAPMPPTPPVPDPPVPPGPAPTPGPIAAGAG
jgi:hypothetical protein